MATRFTFALISLDVLSHALSFMFILLEQTDVYKMYFVYSFSINITVTCVMHFYAGKLTNLFCCTTFTNPCYCVETRCITCYYYIIIVLLLVSG